MHFTTSLLVTLVAVGVQAAPAPEPQPWCWRPGQPCWKVKRAASAFSEAIQSTEVLKERSPEASYSEAFSGGAAHKAKRSINELAHLTALTTRNPEDYFNALGLDKRFGSDEGSHEKRDPSPWCWRPGQPCWKRDSSGDDVPTKDKRWCDRPGQPCWKTKRAANAVLKAIRSDDKVEGGDENENQPPMPGSFPPECNGPRILCWKKREASPEANPEPWCWRPGQPCWKAKRDLHALELAARNIVDES